MMKPTSLLWFVLVCVGVFAVIAMSGCRKISTFSGRPATPTPASPAVERPVQPSTRNALVVSTIKQYLAALREHDYAAAYELLSRDSQSIHSRASFEQQGKQGMPLYDLETARVTINGNQADVVIQQLEDPATHDFHLVREDGEWHVVYRGGAPSQPYPE